MVAGATVKIHGREKHNRRKTSESKREKKTPDVRNSKKKRKDARRQRNSKIDKQSKRKTCQVTKPPQE